MSHSNHMREICFVVDRNQHGDPWLENTLTIENFGTLRPKYSPKLSPRLRDLCVKGGKPNVRSRGGGWVQANSVF